MTERQKKLMTRWSVVTAGAIALFWAAWYLANGNVPVVNEIEITKDWTYTLPFGISRWWDILLGPLYSAIFILLFTSKTVREDKVLRDSLVAGLVIGLVVGLDAGLGAGLVAGLGAGLGASLVVGLGTGLVVGLGAGLGAGLVAGLGAGLGASLGANLGASLVASLVVGLVVGLVAGLSAIKPLIVKSWKWLLVK